MSFFKSICTAHLKYKRFQLPRIAYISNLADTAGGATPSQVADVLKKREKVAEEEYIKRREIDKIKKNQKGDTDKKDKEDFLR
ncbi:hypothetical protein T552_03289 [Pneumocystis carinii B80]|uniref:Uncharacterized protein n=1 Tax=Pneumocystis carinii (strain B80) TaxID=1408658 RepID=A0A0W4ZCF2_PNEC8|nr:hypothetical protein T552_03289 [Pneumocystis carinii B80]KTW26019.1 hypothetical protein T552_03289 [Pneumocystis carinii B80]